MNKREELKIVNIWKIGSWPGLWGSNTYINKNKFINEYALPYNFVAMGYGWIPDFKTLTDEDIRAYLERKKMTKIGRRTNEILSFAYEIEKSDIILLYNHFEVYVGVVKNPDPYYYVELGSSKDFIEGTSGLNIAPHRIDVDWQFDKREFNANFSGWQDTVHKVGLEDFPKIKDKTLLDFIRTK